MNREEAIEKINGEMQKSPDDRVLEAIGHYLIDRITDADAEKVRDKTLKGAVEKMRSAAQKVARGGVGVLTDEEGFAIVRRYFVLRDDALKKAEAEMEERIERETGAIGAMRAEQAVEAVKAQAAAEIAELQKRGDPEIAAARVLFDSILENANRLRGMMLRAEGDKQERLRGILRAVSAKIAEGL